MSSRSGSEDDKRGTGKKDEDTADQVLNISSADVSIKYKKAASITNDAMSLVQSNCIAGASIVDLCKMGDTFIIQKTSEYSKKATFKKGISFPTCISVNGHLAHFSPLRANDVFLRNGDLLKLELGTHIDGYVAISAQSFVVGATKETPVTGKKADAILAAYYGAQAAIRTLKVGTPGQKVADVVLNVANQYECKPVENMLFYIMDQHKLEGDEGILINGTFEGRRDHTQPEVKEHDVFAVDVLVSSGKGTAKVTEVDTTIYKLEPIHYNLRGKRSRLFYTYANSQFGTMPFNLRYFEAEDDNPSFAQKVLPKLKMKNKKDVEIPNYVTCKMGIKECREHGLITQFDVQRVEDKEFVAQFKFTVFVHSKGPEVITFVDFDPSLYSSQLSIKDEDISTLLAEKLELAKPKKKKPNKKPANKSAVPMTSGDTPLSTSAETNNHEAAPVSVES